MHKARPYTVAIKEHPNVPNQLHVLRFKRRLLRSALDRAAYAAAKLAGNTRLKSTQFPISDSEIALENLIKGRKVCADVPDAIVTLFRSFKPYKGGNDTLWAMNKLRNATHTHLLPVWIGGATTDLHWDGGKNELIFGVARKGRQWKYSVHPTFAVCFDDTLGTGLKQGLELLDNSIRIVESVILAIEAECRRLGLM